MIKAKQIDKHKVNEVYEDNEAFDNVSMDRLSYQSAYFYDMNHGKDRDGANEYEQLEGVTLQEGEATVYLDDNDEDDHRMSMSQPDVIPSVDASKLQT